MFRPTYYYMAADVIIVVIFLLRDILLLLYCLAATLFLPLTWRILIFGCQFQLYLPVEGGKLGLQLFQLILLLPCLARYLLQLRYLALQHFVLFLVLLEASSIRKSTGGSSRPRKQASKW